jgi:hypothetical protein
MNKSLIEIIKQIVMNATQGLKANLLGPKYVHKEFTFSLKNYNPATTIAHAYMNSNTMNSADPNSIDKKTLESLENNALNHINKLEEEAHTNVSRITQDYLHNLEIKAKISGKTVEEIKNTKEGKKANKDFTSSINDYISKMNTSASTITDSEIHSAANFGAFDGILHAAKSMGVSDPTVVKLGIREGKCKHCYKLWMLDDQFTPKAYKLGELSGTAGDWRNPVASIAVTHPNCNCVLTILSNGFGFEGGKIVYKGKDPATGQPWDEYSKQRNL